LARTDLGHSFLSVFAPVLSCSLTDLPQTPARFDRLVAQAVGHPGKMGLECCRQDENLPISLHPETVSAAYRGDCIAVFRRFEEKAEDFSPQRREEREANQEKKNS